LVDEQVGDGLDEAGRPTHKQAGAAAGGQARVASWAASSRPTGPLHPAGARRV